MTRTHAAGVRGGGKTGMRRVAWPGCAGGGSGPPLAGVGTESYVRKLMAEFEPRHKTLVDVYDHALSTHAGQPLFGTKMGTGWAWVTYGEFGRLVDSFRGGLAALGVVRGDRVAIISNNRVPWAVAAYACYGLGAVFVPLYEAQAPKDWDFVIRDCGAKILIVANEAVLAKAKGLLGAIPTVTSVVLLEGTTNGDARVKTYASVLASGARPAEGASIRPSPGDTATLLYTSGTTANPKGVILTHGNLASNVSAGQLVFPIKPSDRSLSILPWAHAFGQTAELHTFFACGASMALCEGMDKILDNLAEVKPTLLACVPAIFNRVYIAVQQQLAGRPKPVRALVDRALRAKAKERAGGHLALHEVLVVRVVDKLVFEKVRARLGGKLRFAISGGAALSREVADFIDSIGVLVFEGYGLTETSPVVTVNTPAARKIGSVGTPFPGVRVVIDPSSLEHNSEERRSSHADGEIVVYGPNVMKGYYNHPDETAAVFTADGGFRTGDMGHVDEDGFLFITGRIKEQYKLENGKYVVPAPLEEQLKLSAFVANVMVYGENRPHNVALVVPNVAALRKWAEANHVMLPQGADELLEDERVRALFASEIKARSVDFKGFERIQGFALVSGEFTVETGMLTPKMSLKRRKVVEAYRAVLERLYARGKGVHGRQTAPVQ
jgi:long-chain acyl-CoA synthetase